LMAPLPQVNLREDVTAGRLGSKIKHVG
jgi:hypothetical protein